MFKTIESKITIGIIIVCTILLSFVNIFTIFRMEKQMQQYFERRPLFERLFERRALQIGSQVEQKFRSTLYSTIILTNILGVVLAGISGVLISNHITKPLLILKKGIRDFKTGKAFNLEVTNSDEINEVISEFNSMVNEVEKIQQLREEMVGDIIHELKTPITALAGQVEGIQDGLLKPDSSRLEVLKQEIERLGNLIEELREGTKVKSKILSLEKTEILLSDFLNYIIALFEERLNNKEIKINLNISTNLKVLVDRDLFQQLWMNIIDNAIKYSKANLISISANSKEFVYEDNGIGVPEEQLELIFERFYRVEKSRNKKTGGLGLGLAIVKDIAKAHGWEIQAFKSEMGGLGINIEVSSMK